jgi:hypothetical protein
MRGSFAILQVNAACSAPRASDPHLGTSNIATGSDTYNNNNMRLINCKTLELEQFFNPDIPDYAILSHTWGSDEVTFADALHQAPATARSGYRKIQFICKQAVQDGLQYAWIDTCCIDKSSSAELSEAINSMFDWYLRSSICYAFLEDVTIDDFKDTFSHSRWFTRGWTLQELLAPEKLVFYDRDGSSLGTRRQYADWISQFTTINSEALREGVTLATEHVSSVSLGTFCIAMRMSWASHRSTTRVEDTAYCLLGMFGINMPLLYGEGRRSFVRLQEEIMKHVDDDSILAWGLDTEIKPSQRLDYDRNENGGSRSVENILASSPKDFENCGDIWNEAPTLAPFAMNNTGLQIQLPLVPVLLPDSWDRGPFLDRFRSDRVYAGLLSCSPATSHHIVGILLNIPAESSGLECMGRTYGHKPGGRYHTVLIDPVIAARYMIQNLTIVRNNDVRHNRIARRMHLSAVWKHIVVNLSPRLHHIGYRAANGRGWFYDGKDRRLEIVEGYTIPNWNLASHVYTWRTRYYHQHFLSFAFEIASNRPETAFSVFMLTTSQRTITRRGTVFSESDLFNIGSQLEDPQSLAHSEKVLLNDDDGMSFDLEVGFTEPKLVYRWWISDVNVDVAGFEDPSLTTATWSFDDDK